MKHPITYVKTETVERKIYTLSFENLTITAVVEDETLFNLMVQQFVDDKPRTLPIGGPLFYALAGLFQSIATGTVDKIKLPSDLPKFEL